MKNLVLPGVGRIAIVDNKIVEQKDLDKNFFVKPADLGKVIKKIKLLHI